MTVCQLFYHQSALQNIVHLGNFWHKEDDKKKQKTIFPILEAYHHLLSLLDHAHRFRYLFKSLCQENFIQIN